MTVEALWSALLYKAKKNKCFLYTNVFNRSATESCVRVIFARYTTIKRSCKCELNIFSNEVASTFGTTETESIM